MDTIAYCEVTQCDKHPKETVKMACKTCYLFACVICNGPGKCAIKHMTKNHLICEICHPFERDFSEGWNRYEICTCRVGYNSRVSDLSRVGLKQCIYFLTQT